jgi:hypothetical protein
MSLLGSSLFYSCPLDPLPGGVVGFVFFDVVEELLVERMAGERRGVV